jgi:hypothetical protein
MGTPTGIGCQFFMEVVIEVSWISLNNRVRDDNEQSDITPTTSNAK